MECWKASGYVVKDIQTECRLTILWNDTAYLHLIFNLVLGGVQLSVYAMQSNSIPLAYRLEKQKSIAKLELFQK